MLHKPVFPLGAECVQPPGCEPEQRSQKGGKGRGTAHDPRCRLDLPALSFGWCAAREPRADPPGRCSFESAPAGAKEISPGRKPGVGKQKRTQPRQGRPNPGVARARAEPRECSFAPVGAGTFSAIKTHGSRRGLLSFAPAGAGNGRLTQMRNAPGEVGCSARQDARLRRELRREPAQRELSVAARFRRRCAQTVPPASAAPKSVTSETVVGSGTTPSM